jgi:DNA-binding transcriptional ArsR family regulator
MPPDAEADTPADTPAGTEAVAEQVFGALADPTRRAILAALASGGPTTATDLAVRLPHTRQAIAKHLALLAEAGLVTAEPGERRRVRYRLRSAPMQVAQQFLAALARDWDSPLAALTARLDRAARQSGPTALHEMRGQHDGHDHEDSPDRHAPGMGGSAAGAARQGEGADPRP